MPYVKKIFKLEQEQRINLFLVENLNLPLNVVSRLIDKGKVRLDGEVLGVKGKRAKGTLEVIYRAPLPSGLKPIFSTQDFAIFDKPSGLLVHQNGFCQENTLLDDINYLYGPNANLVHRLDRQTSGLVMASKRKSVEGKLKSLFRDRLVEKMYLALVKGNLKSKILIDKPILSGEDRPIKEGVPRVISTVSSNGLKARTMVYPLKYFQDLSASLVQCHLITGRTHQIRVHLAAIGHRILGDPFYGVGLEVANEYLDTKMSKERLLELTGATRLMLHSFSMRFFYGCDFFIRSSDDFLKKSFLGQFLRE